MQSCRDQGKLIEDIRRALKELNLKTHLVLQWIPSHCGVQGNERADRLSKEGSKEKQYEHPVPYSEAKTLLRNFFHNTWRERLGTTTGRDSLDLLTRREQVQIFRLRTGHCRLLAHLNRLHISHTDECPCGTSPQTPEHILQNCPLFVDLRQATWTEGADFQEKLWGSAGSLWRTAGFITATKLDI